MFYNCKPVFLILLYCMCAVLYYFVNQQIILAGFMSGFIRGSIALYGLVVLSSFLISFLIALISKYFYIAGCGICKIKPRQMLPQTVWMIFTILSYVAVFIIFLKMIEY